MGRLQYLNESGPKRLLSIDGGGVRGVIALEFLTRIESLLKMRYKREDLVLSDYFDLIGGTSTGAIIAAALALGYPCSQISDLYQHYARSIFKSGFWQVPPWRWFPFRRWLFPKYSSRNLENLLKEHFYMTLGDEQVQTGLVIMAKRYDTGSPWAIVNAPGFKYSGRPEDDPKAFSNKDYFIWELVRASTAAPTYFSPKFLRVMGNRKGVFVDGGVSSHINPALAMMTVANFRNFGLGWKIDRNSMFLVSVGTGSIRPRRTVLLNRFTPPIFQAFSSLADIITENNTTIQTTLHWMSDTVSPHNIDGLLRDLNGQFHQENPVITFARYNALLERNWLERLGLNIPKSAIRKMEKFDDPSILHVCRDIGREAATRQITEHDFPENFDV